LFIEASQTVWFLGGAFLITCRLDVRVRAGLRLLGSTICLRTVGRSLLDTRHKRPELPALGTIAQAVGSYDLHVQCANTGWTRASATVAAASRCLGGDGSCPMRHSRGQMPRNEIGFDSRPGLTHFRSPRFYLCRLRFAIDALSVADDHHNFHARATRRPS
jgi:hypothetical protein